jgi:hypothetical protein
VEAGVSQEELQQILSQLRNLVRSPPAAYASTQQSYASYPLLPRPHPQPPYHQSPSYTQLPSQSLKSEAVEASSVLGLQTSAPTNNIADLFNALIKAGVVSASATPTGAGATVKEDAVLSQPVDAVKESRRSYRKLIFSQKIKLTSADVTKSVTLCLMIACTDLLYSGLVPKSSDCCTINYHLSVNNAAFGLLIVFSAKENWKITLTCTSDRIVRLSKILGVVIVEVGSSDWMYGYCCFILAVF